jgi:phosphoserine phosphatase
LGISQYKLILFDVDSTLIQQEVIDLLAQRTDHGDSVASITNRAMAGELDFDQALTERVALLKGLPASVIDEVCAEITFSPGALDLIAELRKRNFVVGAVSGGFINVLSKLFHTLSLDYLRANNLEIEGDVLTGRVLGSIVNRAAKKDSLIEFAAQHSINLSETIAVGDGANDLEMIRTAGLGVSFRGKPILNQAADVTLTDSRLDALLEHL